MQVGETFVVVDAGGGTVDLISYTIMLLEPVLKVKEASPGTGSFCGSCFLDKMFQHELQERFGSNPGWDSDVLENAMRRFELEWKRPYRREQEDIIIPLKGLKNDPATGVQNGRYQMPWEDFQAIFKPVIQEIMKLVHAQIAACEQLPTTILLVGGFGESSHLRNEIRKSIDNKIEVKQCKRGWTSVMRGALLKGLASATPIDTRVIVGERRARRHVGLDSLKPLGNSIHEEKHVSWSNVLRRWEVLTMDWFLEKGAAVRELKPFKFTYHMHLEVSKTISRQVSITIRYYESEDNKEAPIYRTDDVRSLVTVTADLNKVPKSKIPVITGKDGKKYYEFHFAVAVTYFSASTKYELIYDNVNYGTISTEYA